MGDYLMLSWLQTKRGFTIFILFVLIAAVAGFFNLVSYKEKAKGTVVKNSLTQARPAKLPAK
jgi:hypothetical protein